MNKCEKWGFCPLGDTAKLVGCRKPWCPKGTMADTPRPFSKDIVVAVKKRK